jgi:hypothetical protein
MWNVVILSAMVAVAGYYTLSDQRILPNPEYVVARNLAASMGIYRQAVINYSSAPANRAVTGPVDPSGFFPTGYTAEVPSLWSNYIDPNGTIYVFRNPNKALPVNITAEIVSLSQNSVLAGEAGATDNKLHAPADVATPVGWVNDVNNTQDIPLATDYHGAPPIPLTPSSATPIVPPGSPVWLAYRN